MQDAKKKLDEARMPDEVKKVADKELKRLERINPMSPEHTVARTYLEYLAGMPWQTATPDNKDINQAEAVLDEDHYDLDKVNYQPGVAKSGYQGNEPWFDAVEINCRVVALVSRWCMAVGWEDFEKPEFQAYTADSAKKLGVSVVNGFTGSSIWQLVYDFPPVPRSMIDAGYALLAERWNPLLDVF